MPDPVLRPCVIPLLACLTAALACGGDSPPVPKPDPASLRTLSQGPVVGFAVPERDAHAWKGLPFAAPPVGELRWRAPAAPAPWSGTREARESAAECVQYDILDPTTVKGDEDCLYLDVYAPRFTADAVPKARERLPVMVWIHGGGNSIGGATVYDASRLADENGVIVVVIQYRLGVLGWLSHPALRATARNADDASGNFGTLDTIRALEWVRENANAFGGDPSNVTIFGESAGGVDVFALLLSPPARGLFQRAIAQSGILFSTTRAEAEHFVDAEEPGMPGSSGELLLGHLVADGRAKDREAAKPVLAAMSSAEIEAYLRGKSGEELVSVFDTEVLGGMYFVPQVVRDGHVIVDLPALEALASKQTHNAVPTIVGTNREETKLFSLFMSPYVRHLFGLPVGFSNYEAFDLGGEYGGLLWKAQGADQPAEAMRSSGRQDVYGYRFDWDEEGGLLWLDLDKMLGAAHAIDLLFVFGFTDLGRWTDTMFADRESAEQLSARVRSYWTQFARTGDPGRGVDGSLPAWQPWGDGVHSPRYLTIDSEAGGGMRMANDIVTVRSVLEKLEQDDRFRSVEQRCLAFADLNLFSGAFGPDDYQRFDGGACARYPLAMPGPLGEPPG